MRRKNKHFRQRFARDELPDDELRTDPPKRDDGLRCEVTVTHHIGGRRFTRAYLIYAGKRVDCHRIVRNGAPLDEHHGMAWVFEDARKGMPRELGKRARE